MTDEERLEKASALCDDLYTLIDEIAADASMSVVRKRRLIELVGGYCNNVGLTADRVARRVV